MCAGVCAPIPRRSICGPRWAAWVGVAPDRVLLCLGGSRGSEGPPGQRGGRGGAWRWQRWDRASQAAQGSGRHGCSQREALPRAGNAGRAFTGQKTLPGKLMASVFPQNTGHGLESLLP